MAFSSSFFGGQGQSRNSQSWGRTVVRSRRGKERPPVTGGNRKELIGVRWFLFFPRKIGLCTHSKQREELEIKRGKRGKSQEIDPTVTDRKHVIFKYSTTAVTFLLRAVPHRPARHLTTPHAPPKPPPDPHALQSASTRDAGRP